VVWALATVENISANGKRGKNKKALVKDAESAARVL